ncbi:hypothetical protein SAMN05216584_10496 [Selenomonas sp. WCT3]|uniref:hypothetical protein n=1 Tax=Selenomonas sp. WCT3 TaxID=3158785 RepID=UPI00088BBCFC|nr:hypothetical protein SAMN05216584_10496 [Selenomonas ruminantium]
MESILMIIVFVLFAVLSDKSGSKKKAPVPRPENSAAKTSGNLGFKIPELRNAPDSSKRDAEWIRLQEQAYRKEQEAKRREAEYKKQRLQQEADIRAAEEAAYEVQAKLVSVSKRKPKLQIPVLTPETAQQAVVFAEILGRPKAYRRRR